MLTLKGHKEPVQSVSFSADGATVLSVDRANKIRVWNAIDGTLRWAVDSGYFATVTFTPDGAHVLTCDRASGREKDQNGKTRAEFDRRNPNLLRAVATGTVSPVSIPRDGDTGLANLLFSPDTTRCVAMGGGLNDELTWWQYPSWEALTIWKVQPHRHHPIQAIAFSPDGRTLAGMNGYGVHFYEVNTAELLFLHQCKVTQQEYRLAYHPDGRHLAIGSGTRLAILDLESRTEIAELTQAKKFFLQAAFRPDGRYLATVSNEETVKLWDTSLWTLAKEYAWEVGGLRTVAFSPDGKLLATGGMGKKVVVWDCEL